MTRPSSGRLVRAVLAAALALSCTYNGTPCTAPSCRSGYECLANTCTPAGAEPVPRDTLRVVLEPSSVAGADAAEANGGTVDLGRDLAALFLRFDTSWKRDGAVVRAFLLLQPAGEAVQAGGDDLKLDVWTIQAPWTPSRIAIGARPGLAPPRARGLLRTSPPTTARIDVTDIVRALAKTPEDNGFAVLAGESQRAAVRTGSTGGAPRLELYVRASR